MKMFHLFKALFLLLFVYAGDLIANPVPDATSITPVSGPPGQGVGILGSGFQNITHVNFDSIQVIAKVNAAGTQIKAILPNAALNETPRTVPISLFDGTTTFPTNLQFAITGSWNVLVTNFGENNGGVVMDGSVSIFPDTLPFPAIAPKVNDPNNVFPASQPLGIAIHPDGTTAYVTTVCPTCGTIVVIDIATATVVNTLNLGAGVIPYSIAINSLGTYAFVNGNITNLVYILDLSTKPQYKQAPVVAGSFSSEGLGPRGIAISSDNAFLYVTNNDSTPPNLVTFSLSQATPPVATVASVVNLIDNGNYIYIALTPASANFQKLYVSSDRSSNPTIYRFDLTNPSMPTSPLALTLSGKPAGMAIDPAGNRLYAAQTSQNVISVIDVHSDTFLFDITIPGANNMRDLVVTPDGNTLFVTDQVSGTVYMIPLPADGQPPSTFIQINVGLGPLGIAITPDQAPLAGFEVTSQGVAGSTPTTFSAVGLTANPVDCNPPSGSTYFWDFGDCSFPNPVAGTTPTISHQYAASGTYQVTLTVQNCSGTSTSTNFPTGRTLSNNGGPSAQICQTITVPSQPPTATSLNPTFGPASGGTTVTLTGTNFSCVEEVTFGANSAGIVSISPDGTILTVISPPGIAGTSVPVTVKTCGGSASPGSFTYQANLFPPQNVKGKQIVKSGKTVNVISWDAPLLGERPVAYQIFQDASLTISVGIIKAKPNKEHYKVSQKANSREPKTFYLVSVDQFGNKSTPVKVTIHSKHKHHSSSGS